MRVLALAVTAIMFAVPASAACTLKICTSDTFRDMGPTKRDIRSDWNTGRVKLGDLYSPGHGRPTQIRNNSRQILGYIESDGTITNTSRQPVATIEGLLE